MTPDQACSHENLIDLEAALVHAVRAVDRRLPGDERVSPLVFARMARGGKTTFFCELFDRLVADNKAVTFITLHNLTQRKDENGRDTLLRLIALQLLPELSLQDALNVRVDETALFEVIDITRGGVDGRPWVLLIDELNNLGVPMDAFACDLLRRILDRKGYFVVFTSHVPMTVSGEGSVLAKTFLLSEKVPVSDRAVTTVPLPICTDVSILSRMFSAREPRLQVTPSEVSMYLGIPSLIYVTKRHDEDSPAVRFDRQRIIVEQAEALGVLRSFMNEVLTGEQDARQRSNRFYLFGQMPQEMHIQWPICYIACILDMTVFNLCLNMKGTINTLAVQAERTESGLDWEIVVQVAILLQSINAKVNGGSGPFGIVDDRQCMCVVTREFPVNVVTVEAANAYIEHELTTCVPGTILVATPKYSKFPDWPTSGRTALCASSACKSSWAGPIRNERWRIVWRWGCWCVAGRPL